MDYRAVLLDLPQWRGKRLRIRRLLGGGTNDNFLVTVGQSRYVARFQGEPQKKFLKLDRQREIHNTRIAHRLGIGPEVVAYYKQLGLLLVRYQDGRVLQPVDLRRPETLHKVVALLRRLHAGPKFRGRFSVKSSIEYFWRIAREDGKPLPNATPYDRIRYRRCLNIITGRKARLVPCHVDLVSINMIRRGTVIKLIDWDYSAMADPLFELAFMAAWSRFRPVHDKNLLTGYFGRVNNDLLRQFAAMRTLVHLREVVWALTQLGRSTVPFNYRAYANKHARWFRQVPVG